MPEIEPNNFFSERPKLQATQARNSGIWRVSNNKLFKSEHYLKINIFLALTDVHKTNTRELDTLRTELDGLNAQMDGYLEKIRTSADNYRYCT